MEMAHGSVLGRTEIMNQLRKRGLRGRAFCDTGRDFFHFLVYSPVGRQQFPVSEPVRLPIELRHRAARLTYQ